MINLNNVKETTGNGSSVRYISPGIKDVQILGFEKIIANNQNEVIKGVLVDFNTDEQHEEMYPTTQEVKPGKQKSALDISLIKLRHICRACLNAEEFETLWTSEFETLDSLVETLNSYLVGKKYRQKFTGEEKMSQRGNIYAIARVPLPNGSNPMAENINVPIEKSQLSFDKNNINDYKKYVEPSLGGPGTFGALKPTPASDMPF